ncbi:ankyrin repeat domain-containing protein [Candidatus Tisiphia endosymbiont of Nedyus quadrimaculatus]|uniref:ankyrin repeat domain-containing protein n=1 Tax=Candidatus Tisiphia endosymbiont of Nedyus quadrimaculatus TaxID=3139332 RepID=UPI00345EE872
MYSKLKRFFSRARKLSLSEQLLNAIQAEDKTQCITIVSNNEQNLENLDLSKCQLALLKNLADNQNQESHIFSDFKQSFVDRLSVEHIPSTFSRQISTPSRGTAVPKTFVTQKSVPSSIPIVDISLSELVSTSSRASSVQEPSLDSIDSMILYRLIQKNDTHALNVCLGHNIDHNIVRSILDTTIKQDNVEIVELLLGYYTDVNAKNSLGNTLLHIAVKSKSKKIVELLLNGNTDVNIAFLHNSPLYIAISNNSTEIVELLLTKLQTVTKEELFKAVKNGNTQIVQLLLPKITNIDAIDYSGRTALHIASSDGNINMVEFLLQHQANPNTKDNEQKTPLESAISNNSTEIVELLLTKLQTVTKEELFKAVKNDNTHIIQLLLPKITNIDINTIDYSGRTELHIASSDGNINMVKFLLQYQANPNTKDNKQKTPLESAIYHGHLNIVKLLFDHKAHDDLTHLLVTAAVNNHNKIVKLLLEEKNANPRNTKYNAMPLLHVMITKGNIDIVKMLIEHGGNINVVYNCEYPIDVAIKKEQYQILEYLLEHKDKMVEYFYAVDFSDLLLSKAIHNDCPKLLDILLEKQHQEVNSLCKYKGSPFKDSSSLIHIAAYYGNLVQHLLNKGVNIDLVDKNGDTVAHVAVMRNNIDVFKTLLNKGANIDIKNNNGTSVLDLVNNSNNQNFVDYRQALDKLSACVIPIIVDETQSLNASHRNILQQYQEVRENLLFIHYIKQGLEAHGIDNTSDINNLWVKLNNRISESYFQITNIVQTKCVLEKGFEISTDILMKICKHLKLTDIINDTKATCTSDVSDLGACSDLISFDS